MSNLYSYLFWYNVYDNFWYAIDRDSLLLFFNGRRSEAKYFKSPKQEALIALLFKGDPYENASMAG